MTMGDLDLAVRERLPLLVVCMNDEAYGSEVVLLRNAGFPEADAVFATPSLSHVARSMGCAGEEITSLDQLAEVATLIGTVDRPLLLDCKISRDVTSSLAAAPAGEMKARSG